MTTSKLHQRDYEPERRGTLDGVRILDLSRLFAGNVLTQMLGDFGADVIKVEPPEGDTLRAWKTEGVSTHWKIYARNKKSLCLDLRSPQAAEIIRALVPTSDLFIESFRPGVLEKMGLGPDTLLELNPKLVVMRISGWGQDGPYSQRPGFGTVVEGISGFAAINGFADREPVLPPMYLADGIAGLYGASAAMIALREVEMNGGQRPGHRPAAAGPALLHPRPPVRQLPSHGQGQAADREPLDELGPAQCLPLQGRAVRQPLRLDPEDGRAAVPVHRPA